MKACRLKTYSNWRTVSQKWHRRYQLSHEKSINFCASTSSTSYTLCVETPSDFGSNRLCMTETNESPEREILESSSIQRFSESSVIALQSAVRKKLFFVHQFLYSYEGSSESPHETICKETKE